GETPAADPATLIGRTAEVTVQELTGDFSKMHIKVKFKINSVDGYNAKSVFVGHSLTSEYVRRLTRRKKTKTDHVVDVKTKDGFVIRIKPMSIAEKRIQASQEDAMRRIMHDVLMQMGVENNLSDIIKAIISGDMARDLAKACRTIMPMKRIEIRKSEILEFAEENDSAIEAPKEEAPEEDGPEEGSAEETSEEKEPEEESEE
ncbi:MAG: 30S ribosomal protein S3ae, partial [Candidatus Methanomethylophilaceae archaeon]|nr:30S ribosomal protein S3ae [Candidatus Methanomethylophilaceae archaeon]